MKKLTIDMVTPTIDLNIIRGVHMDLKYLMEKHQLDFDVVLNNGKNLQRGLVWTTLQKESLIISILRRISIPNFSALIIYINNSDDRICKIIDGKQRLTTIISFYKNEFPITVNGEKYFYDDLDKQAKNVFKNAPLIFEIVYDFGDDDEIKITDEHLINWFEFINFMGTPQDADHLKYLKNN